MGDNLNTATISGRSWDLEAILDYVAAFRICDSNTEQVIGRDVAPLRQWPCLSRGRKLGDFQRLWDTIDSSPTNSKLSNDTAGTCERDLPAYKLPKPNTAAISIRPISHGRTSTTCFDEFIDEQFESTPPSSAPEDHAIIAHVCEERQLSEHCLITTPKRKARQATVASRRRREVISLLLDPDGSSIVAKAHKSTPKTLYHHQSTRQHSSTSDSEQETDAPGLKAKGRSTITVALSQLQSGAIGEAVIRPVHSWSREEQISSLANKLRQSFKSLPLQSILVGKDYSKEGLHIFIDISNIVISFYTKLKQSRGLHRNFPISGTFFNFESLAMILERGRKVARRIIVGSYSASLPSSQPKRAVYLAEAEKCGYEINLLERVLKYKPPRDTKKRVSTTGNGYATVSGYSSGDEVGLISKVMSEQAVDEVLHMKLLESLVDTAEPSTIVLATGDAAEAEYSGGFLKNVERALQKGWNVELVAWRENMSYDYRHPQFLKKWKHRFSIVELDDYLEELLALYYA